MNQFPVMHKKQSASSLHMHAIRCLSLFGFALSAHAASPPTLTSMADMSLEELANIEITSVSKKSERLADAAGSVFVITAEDIRRSGATSLPEALRLAPNLHVAQSSASAYAISARGANGSSSSGPNKMLVLIDGRSVYTPLFSGIFWDVQDVMLEDVERIEVISGPGGTLWGLNAVNGVVNVITRRADETQGRLVSAHAGTRSAGVAFRHGWTGGGDGSYRVYGKSSKHDHMSKADGSPVDDAWRKSQIGFRADWDRPGEQFTVQGNAYSGRFGQPEPGSISISGTDLELGTIRASGANLTARWTHLLEDGSNISLQAYYDRTERSIPPTISESLDIADFQFQHALLPIGRHALTWGANLRYSRDRVANNSSVFAFLPEHVNQKWSSLFAQDEITVRDDIRLTFGTRVERNPYTGNEWLPNARLAWKPAPDHLLWAAISRAARAPSRLDADAFIPRTAPFLLAGGPQVRSEVAKTAELGYRGNPDSAISYSITAFQTVYDHLRTQEIDPGGTFVTFANEMEGETSGIETWGAYQVSTDWRLSAGYTLLKDRLRLKPGSNDLAGPLSMARNPAHTWQIRSALQLAPDQTLDIAVRHVAALSATDVPAYTGIDVRFGWRLQPDVELSVTGINLLDSDHAEYGPVGTRSVIPSTVFVQLLMQL